MKRKDYELIARVIKRLPKEVSPYKGTLCLAFSDELEKNGNFDPDKFTKDCGL